MVLAAWFANLMATRCLSTRKTPTQGAPRRPEHALTSTRRALRRWRWKRRLRQRPPLLSLFLATPGS